MKLHQLTSPSSNKTRRRRGQGNGSNRGTFSGRGCKGQNARAGGGVRLGFEGGQSGLLRRMPKLRGFRNPNRVAAQVISTSTLSEHFKAKAKVNFDALLEKKLVNKNNPKVKVLLDEAPTVELNIDGLLVSKSAQAAIEKAGGSVA